MLCFLVYFVFGPICPLSFWSTNILGIDLCAFCCFWLFYWSVWVFGFTKRRDVFLLASLCPRPFWSTQSLGPKRSTHVAFLVQKSYDVIVQALWTREVYYPEHTFTLWASCMQAVCKVVRCFLLLACERTGWTGLRRAGHPTTPPHSRAYVPVTCLV